jgi:hypothetical protein
MGQDLEKNLLKAIAPTLIDAAAGAVKNKIS